MKKSQEIVLSDQQNLPPNRREVMKKILGLTLGSGALGLAGLGASTSAEAALSATYLIELDQNSVFQPLFARYPNYFNIITNNKPLSQIKCFVTWRSDPYTMLKTGTVVIKIRTISFGIATWNPIVLGSFNIPLSSSIGDLSETNIFFADLYDNNKNFFHTKPSWLYPDYNSPDLITPIGYSEELRRKLWPTTAYQTIPYQKHVLAIYNEWIKRGRATQVPIEIDSIQYTVSNISETFSYQTTAATRRQFNFTLAREFQVTAGPPPTTQTRRLDFEVFGLTVGGFSLFGDITHFSRVTLRQTTSPPANEIPLSHLTTTYLVPNAQNSINTIGNIAASFATSGRSIGFGISQALITGVGGTFTNSVILGAAVRSGPDVSSSSASGAITLVSQLIVAYCVIYALSTANQILRTAADMGGLNGQALSVYLDFFKVFNYNPLVTYNNGPWDQNELNTANANLNTLFDLYSHLV